MSQYKELADRLDRSTRHDAYMHAVIAKAIAILRSLDEQPVAEVMVMGSYRGKPILGCVLHSDSAKVGDKLYAAPVAAQPQQATSLSDAEFAIDMLEMMFTAYENGTPCYEDPEDEVGFMGYAFRLADDDFKNIGDFLNRVRPVQSCIKEQG